MPDEHENKSVDTGSSGNLLHYVLLGVAAVYIVVSLYYIVESRGRIDKLEAAQTAAKAENAQLLKRLGIAETSLKAENQVLAEKVGLTQKEIASRSAALQRQQREAEQRLSEQTKQPNPSSSLPEASKSCFAIIISTPPGSMQKPSAGH